MLVVQVLGPEMDYRTHVKIKTQSKTLSQPCTLAILNLGRVRQEIPKASQEAKTASSRSAWDTVSKRN